MQEIKVKTVDKIESLLTTATMKPHVPLGHFNPLDMILKEREEKYKNKNSTQVPTEECHNVVTNNYSGLEHSGTENLNHDKQTIEKTLKNTETTKITTEITDIIETADKDIHPLHDQRMDLQDRNQMNVSPSLSILSTHKIDPSQPLTASWQFAAVCGFFQLFNSGLFNLFTACLSSRLEKELLKPTEWLFKLFTKLFKNYYKSRNTRLSNNNLVFYLKKESLIKGEWALEYMSFLHDSTYIPHAIPTPPPAAYIKPSLVPLTTLLDLSPHHRLLALFFLTELQFDCEWRGVSGVDEEVGVAWRVMPVGWDRWGCRYWLFDDSRLFREAPLNRLNLVQETAVAVNHNMRRGESISSLGGITEGEGEELGTSTASTIGLEMSTSASTSTIADPNTSSNPPLKLRLKLTRPTLKPPKQPWTLMCRTRAEWEGFPGLFVGGGGAGEWACRAEEEFHRYLFDLVPLVIRDIEAASLEKKSRRREDREWDVREVVPLEFEMAMAASIAATGSGGYYNEEVGKKRKRAEEEAEQLESGKRR